MKKTTKKQTIEIDGIVLTINAKEYSGCYIKILHTCKNQLDSMLSHHCKLFTYRFDLHLKNATDDNRDTSTFIRKLRKRLTAKYKFKRMAFIWVREQHDAQTQHYHLVLMLDGNKIQHPKTLHPILTKIAEQLKMTAIPCPRPYANLDRANLEKYKSFFYRLSYFAKQRGKEAGKRKKTANDYSASRIKANPDNAWQGRLEDFASTGLISSHHQH